MQINFRSWLGIALDLPFSDDKFDLVTISFGLRNLADREKGLREIYQGTEAKAED